MTDAPLQSIIAPMLGPAPKQADQSKRDWSFYLFFRIRQPTAQLDALRDDVLDIAGGGSTDAATVVAHAADVAAHADDEDDAAPVDASHANFLSAASGGSPATAPAATYVTAIDNAAAPPKIEDIAAALEAKSTAAVRNKGVFVDFPVRQDVANLATRYALKAMKKIVEVWNLDPIKAGLAVHEDGLVTVAYYEALRQIRLIQGGAAVLDPAPSSLAYTWRGLEKLRLDPETLASFPEAFREGMARRAHRLGDDGPSAPENWEGSLGLDEVHGVLYGGFQIGDAKNRPMDKHWRKIYEDLDAMNARRGLHGQALRLAISLIYSLFGMDPVHIEIGVNPYEVGTGKQDGEALKPDIRREHFGFRDGVSQPFVDLGLKDPPPGGGRPIDDGGWAPVAAGEIFLGRPDEDGHIAETPTNKTLREGGSYLVFRKLEQDVVGFRAFLADQRPNDPDSQAALAAQIVGRWPNGDPLVLSPKAPVHVGAEPPRNDFRFVADDPDGEKCPLGAHIRRANPRDIGGSKKVARHRMLRRGMAYGGPLLADGEPDDGRKRGLLFVAACAQIDVQFELIQGVWLNGGDFLGQADLGKCPLIGANDGGVGDKFTAQGEAQPIRRMPRFVTTKGGNYFYAPSKPALAELARHVAQLPTNPLAKAFPTKPEDRPLEGYGFGDKGPDDLFSDERLMFLLDGARRPAPLQDLSAVRVRLKGPGIDETSEAARPVVFGRSHADLSAGLAVVKDGAATGVTMPHYLAATTAISGGLPFISAEAPADQPNRHTRLHALLGMSWAELATRHKGMDKLHHKIKAIGVAAAESGVIEARSTGRIDLVRDLAGRAIYAMTDRVIGTPGPEALTELAFSLKFAKRHVGDVPPEWLALLKGPPPNKAYATLMIWSYLSVLDISGNVMGRTELRAISAKAGSEMELHIRTMMAAARRNQPKEATLLSVFADDAFALKAIQRLYLPGASEAEFKAGLPQAKGLYAMDAIGLLMELAGTGLATVQSVFGRIMEFYLKAGVDLTALATNGGLATDDQVDRALMEAERLSPAAKWLLRQATRETTLPSGAVLKPGDWFAGVFPTANLDATVFDEPFRHKLDRDLNKYLTFGPPAGGKACWGRDRFALASLRAAFRAASRLESLRPVAGYAGEPEMFLGVVPMGLTARFSGVLPLGVSTRVNQPVTS